MSSQNASTVSSSSAVTRDGNDKRALPVIDVGDRARLELRSGPGERLSCTWSFVNVGDAAIAPNALQLIFAGGHKLDGQSATLPFEVPPHSRFDVTLPVVAPRRDGDYVSFWRLRDAEGRTGHRVSLKVVVTGGEPNFDAARDAEKARAKAAKKAAKEAAKRHKEALKSLKRMGYPKSEQVAELVSRHDGDVSAVVSALAALNVSPAAPAAAAAAASSSSSSSSSPSSVVDSAAELQHVESKSADQPQPLPAEPVAVADDWKLQWKRCKKAYKPALKELKTLGFKKDANLKRLVLLHQGDVRRVAADLLAASGLSSPQSPATAASTSVSTSSSAPQRPLAATATDGPSVATDAVLPPCDPETNAPPAAVAEDEEKRLSVLPADRRPQHKRKHRANRDRQADTNDNRVDDSAKKAKRDAKTAEKRLQAELRQEWRANKSQYKPVLQRVHSLGFAKRWQTKAVIVRHRGNFDAVVDTLTSALALSVSARSVAV